MSNNIEDVHDGDGAGDGGGERGGRRHLFQRRYPQFGGFISLGSEGSLYGPTTCPSLLGKLENLKAPPYMFQDQAS